MAWSAPKSAAVLIAMLCVSGGKPLSRAFIASSLWPETADTIARDYLRHLLTKLRAALGPGQDILISHPDGSLSIEFEQVSCDLIEIEALVNENTLDSLTAALEMVRGPLLKDSQAEWVVSERHRIDALISNAAGQLADLCIQNRSPLECLAQIEHCYKMVPHSEAVVRCAMRILMACGRLTDASDIYQSYKTRLRKSLGAKPEEESARLNAEIHKLAAEKIAPVLKRRKILPVQKGNLPQPMGTLYGRDALLRELCTLLESGRLVTLTGPGGIGKTQLSLHAAVFSREDYTDGTWFADLSAAANAAQIWQVISATLQEGQPANADVSSLAIAFPVTARALLILDNCEHIIRECREIVPNLHAACPGLTLLLTSRIALKVPGEKEVRCNPLDLPPPRITKKVAFGMPLSATGTSPEVLLEYPSIALYAHRAQHATRTFVLDDYSSLAVVEICQMMDGIPLAIELCAAWTRCLTVQQIRDRIRERLSLARTPDAATPVRHQTLQNAINWSYELLSPGEQVLWQITALLPVGFTLPTAVALMRSLSPQVASEDACLDSIRSLVDSSILIFQGAPPGNSTAARYKYPDTIRRFAVEMEHSPAYGRAVVTTYTQLGLQVEKELAGPGQAECMRMLDAEHLNFRAAASLAINLEMGGAALDIAISQWRYCYARGTFLEGYSLLEAALKFAPGTASLDRCAAAHAAAGNLALHCGQTDHAEQHFILSAGIQEQRCDHAGMASAKGSLSLIASERGDYDAARELLESAKSIFERIEDTRGVSVCLGNLAIAASHQGDFEAASGYYVQSQERFKAAGDIQRLALGYGNLAGLYISMFSPERAVPVVIEGLELSMEHFSPAVVAHLLLSALAICDHHGNHIASAIIGGADARLRSEYHLPLTSEMSAEQSGLLRNSSQALEDEVFHHQYELGAQLTNEALLEWLRDTMRLYP